VKKIKVLLLKYEGYWVIKTLKGTFLQRKSLTQGKRYFGDIQGATQRILKKDIRYVLKTFDLAEIKGPKRKQKIKK